MAQDIFIKINGIDGESQALRSYLKAQPPAFIPGTATRYYGTVEVR